jgi:hypothetical protein
MLNSNINKIQKRNNWMKYNKKSLLHPTYSDVNNI